MVEIWKYQKKKELTVHIVVKKLDLRLKCKECGKSQIKKSFRTGKAEFVAK